MVKKKPSPGGETEKAVGRSDRPTGREVEVGGRSGQRLLSGGRQEPAQSGRGPREGGTARFGRVCYQH